MKALSLDQLMTYALAHAKAQLIGKPGAQLMPFFHIQFKNKPDAIIPAPWRDENEKAALVAAVRATLKLVRPHVVNYSFISEVWVAEQNHPWRPGDLEPGQRESRKECVLAHASDGLDNRVRVWEIVRGDDGGVTALLADKSAAAQQFSGRLFNLLDD